MVCETLEDMFLAWGAARLRCLLGESIGDRSTR